MRLVSGWCVYRPDHASAASGREKGMDVKAQCMRDEPGLNPASKVSCCSPSRSCAPCQGYVSAKARAAKRVGATTSTA